MRKGDVVWELLIMGCLCPHVRMATCNDRRGKWRELELSVHAEQHGHGRRDHGGARPGCCWAQPLLSVAGGNDRKGK